MHGWIVSATGKRQPKAIVMLGVHPASKQRGGIAAVIDMYRCGGLFARWPISYIGTFESGGRMTKIRRTTAALWDYLRLICKGRVGVVHAHTASRASFWRKSLFLLIAFAARRPTILHLHGAEFEAFYFHECGSLRKKFVRFVLSRVDRVIVLSTQWRELVERIEPRTRVVKIFNPIAAQESGGAIVRIENVLLFLGRFGRRKGIFDLLEALAVIRTRFPSVRLRCGGDGDIAGVERRARELGVDDCVDVLGWVSGSEKSRVLAEAAVYVLPTYAEGLPMGVLEAMAAGAAVVGTTVGGIPDAIEDGVEGFLVAPGDTAALADRITRLLEDADLRHAFARAAQSKARAQFGMHTVLSQLEALYTSLGAAPRQPPEHRRDFREEDRGKSGAAA